MILNPTLDIDRREVMGAMKDADIGYRIITGGCFLRHDVIKYFDYDTVGEIVNANTAHDRGFFVGNHPRDLTPQIERFDQVLDRAAFRPSLGVWYECQSLRPLPPVKDGYRCSECSSRAAPVTSDQRWSRDCLTAVTRSPSSTTSCSGRTHSRQSAITGTSSWCAATCATRI